MCVLCGDLVAEAHWAERPVAADGQGGEAHRRQARFRRVRMVNRVLAAYRLSTHEDLSGTRYVVGNGKGAEEVVRDLAELWPAADRLAGRAIDPLDPELIESLELGSVQ